LRSRKRRIGRRRMEGRRGSRGRGRRRSSSGFKNWLVRRKRRKEDKENR